MCMAQSYLHDVADYQPPLLAQIKGPSFNYVSTYVGQQNANLINKPYSLNMLTEVGQK